MAAARPARNDQPAMLRQSFHEVAIATRGRGLYEFTREVKRWIEQNKFREGLLTIHLQHTSASLLIQENASPDVQSDFERFFERLVPDGDPIFEHTMEGDDDMPAHVRTALTTVNLSIPVRNGQMTLGTWQGIFLWEHRTQGHSRRAALHFIGE
ncbi:MAG TPA: secondary thiamine-phosphate synthase enzyme YjbQ [Candidatus Acidoferrum sp.]|jgi:secondary thiamine-phosphate synthase enzyme|nr:secondary thiamine-phosphate synthase enzyme YjbQ [Candidatus Acidoferrum sp.]